MAIKIYKVYYYTKQNGTETKHSMKVNALNAKEARKVCKELVKQQTGKNAFRPSASAIG